MTGGAELSRTINRNLAEAAQKLGIGMMLGSQRIMLDDSPSSTAAAASFEVRELAPDVLLIGNIGLAQLSDAVLPKLAAALERVGADALAVHTNPLQEAMQDNGDTDFSGTLDRLRRLVAETSLPGAGQRGRTRHRRRSRRDACADIPLAAVDVAGAGGTSWARVEQLVRYGEVRHPAIAEWGVPTAQALQEVRRRCRACRWSPRAASAPAWTPPRRWRWAPTWSRWPVRCWPRRSSRPAAALDVLEGFIEELRVCLHGCGGRAASRLELREPGVTPRAIS